MKPDSLFAVVDLETTGSSYRSGDRLIQIGCTFIQNGQIMDSFEQKIFPERKIPKRIQNLTGINNKMVANMPLFYEVGPAIRNMLEDCVFVAHNVHFDYSFLNYELKKAGLDPLELECIDTVQLSQILLPTEPGYSLSVLADKYGLDLDSPHNALADSMATARLFLFLGEKAKNLPSLTTDKLKDLSASLPYQTYKFFELHSGEANLGDYANHWQEFKGLVLRQNSYVYWLNNYQPSDYPSSQSEKEKIFSGSRSLYPQQIEMMDDIYNYYSHPTAESLAIEGAAGMGKTLAYLFSGLFFASQEKPLLVSTYTRNLQDQIFQQEVAFLNQLLPGSLLACIVKGKRHYIDIEAFYHYLHRKDLDQAEILGLSQILVWLTETQTGDLDELSAIHNKDELWQAIRSSKSLQTIKDGDYASVDFYLLSRRRAERANLIITNHAFLSHDFVQGKGQLPDDFYLIVDEAHELADVWRQASTKTFNLETLRQQVFNFAYSKTEASILDQVQNEIGEALAQEQLVQPLKERSSQLLSQLESYSLLWLQFSKRLPSNPQDNYLIFTFDLDSLPNNLLEKRDQIIRSYLGLIKDIDSLLTRLRVEWRQVSHKERHLLDQVYEFSESFADDLLAFREIFFSSEISTRYLRYEPKKAQQTLTFLHYLQDDNKTMTNFLGHLDHKIYLSASLALDGDISFFAKKIGDPELNFKYYPSPFDYKNQASLWLPDDLLPIEDLSQEEYENMLTYYLAQIIEASQENILVLFNSHDSLQSVYNKLLRLNLHENRTILAQGLSGTRQRIIKRFSQAESAILLGADSFWKGIDIPANHVRILVISRLPFDSPHQLEIQLSAMGDKAKGVNLFQEFLLPKALFKFKQGFGRLIRSKSDKGVVIVLDQRFLYANYAYHFQRVLPHDLPIQTINMDHLQEKISLFFEESEEDH